MKELVSTLVRGLVRAPRGVRVYERRDRGRVFVEVSVDPEDRGRVIGREGRTAQALRTLLSAVARERGETCQLEIID